ncbi:MAG: NAD-dependent epimerase/dehydratase family protein [Nanoarchaeota archaeon]|nr:NAD-dependent epimerase/dehydratase family protein [Nanoarchaeota archaeon]
MKIKNKRFLVTGGASFIGSNTVDALVERGAQVIIVDNFLTGRKENLNPKAKVYKINIVDPKIENIFKKEKPEIIYHFAFNRLFLKSVENPLMDMDSIAGSINLLNNARKYGVKKIIFPSSGFVYGKTKKLPMREIDSPDPATPYAIAKYTVENYLKFFYETYNLPYIILRYATIYGQRQNIGAMADYIQKLSSGKQAEIYGDGTMTRDYIHINDVVRANLLALNIPIDYSNPIFNIGTGQETTLNELYKKIAQLLNKKAKPIYLPGRPGEQDRYFLDCLKFFKATNWRPKIGLEEGLKLTLKFWNLI